MESELGIYVVDFLHSSYVFYIFYMVVSTYSTYSIVVAMHCFEARRTFTSTDVGYVFYTGHLLRYSMSKATLFFYGKLVCQDYTFFMEAFGTIN